MTITLYYHPFSRASGMLWPLEEVGADYKLEFVDILKGEHKNPDLLSKNPMGKIPTLVDGDTVVTECAAISLYLGDRYAYGTLSPKVDDPARATYYRWSTFPAAVIEPAAMAKRENWTYKPSQAGWGTYEDMVASCESAITGKQYVLGDTFSMADIILGGSLRYMTMLKMIEAKPVFTEYIERLNTRPALQRADAKNQESIKAHGLDKR